MDNSGANLQEFILTLPPERQKIINDLLKKNWFQNTDLELQKKLLSLPSDFNNFIKDMGERPEEIGNVEILKLHKLKHGNYLLIPIFLVRSLLTNEEFTYEYTTFKYGARAGFRGIILVSIDNTITHFILRRSHKFQTNSLIYETIGSFNALLFSSEKLLNLPKKIENSIKKLLDQKNLTVKRFIDLGQVYSDTGMTNNHVNIYTAIIDGTQAKKIEESTLGKHLSTWGTKSEIAIIPINQISEYINKTDDSFFLACVVRLVSIGILKF